MEGISLTVSLGDIISAAITIVGIVLAYAALKERISTLESKFDPMWRWWNRRAADFGDRRGHDDD